MAAGIYIHIPFCRQKCRYCDFVSAAGCETDMDKYQNALINEIESTDIRETVDSVFFGGGTPSIYKVEYIEEILSKIVKKYRVQTETAEITLEANPGTVSYEKLRRYRQAGINRISFGLQSADDNELKMLGRIHNYNDFINSYKIARNAGFDNINIDLMSAIPHQTLDTYKETLEKIVKLKPEHISAYSLIIEEGTPFYEEYGDGKPGEACLPDEETDREMYHYTKAFLEKNGYLRYEISNYAKEGMECKHNIKYWSRNNYYGFGVAAASLVDDMRYTNTSDRKDYISVNGDVEKIRAEVEQLNEKDKLEEYMYLGLRKMSGVNISAFKEIFGVDIEEIYGKVIDKYMKDGLLDKKDDRLFLSERGIDVSNIVMSEFLLD